MPYKKGLLGITTPRERLSRKLRDNKYRARLKGCPIEEFSLADAVAAGLLDADKCYLCSVPLGPFDMYCLEHKISLFHKGPHSLANIGKACMKCNEDKHIQDELDYLAGLDLAS